MLYISDIHMTELIAKQVDAIGGTVYFVGGYVRNKLINPNIPNKDIDIEVFGITPEQLREVLANCGKLKEYGKSFGIFGLDGYNIDISMPRRERCVGTQHTDFDVTVDPFMTTYEAAKRRDLTINALMENVLTGEIVDNFGGLDDIQNKVLRHVNPETFIEDPLRVLRVAQFYSRFTDFTVADETKELCKSMNITNLSKERIWEEFCKGLMSLKPSRFFDFLLEVNHLHEWFPEVYKMTQTLQDPNYHPEGNVYNHTMNTLNWLAQKYRISELPIRITALCHDMGKIETTEVINDRIHSYGHEEASIRISETFLRRLTNNKDIIKYVTNMVGLHMRPHNCYNNSSRVKITNHMFDNAVEPMELVTLAHCDSLARYDVGVTNMSTNADKEAKWLASRYMAYVNTMLKPYITGKMLRDELCIPPGPWYKDILALAHKMRLAGVDIGHQLSQINSEYRKLMARYKK